MIATPDGATPDGATPDGAASDGEELSSVIGINLWITLWETGFCKARRASPPNPFAQAIIPVLID
jgi:hypothetical protein